MSEVSQPVVLICATCGEPCQRAVTPPHEWTHTDDYFYLNDVTRVDYNHQAIPDVIDVGRNNTHPTKPEEKNG